jgi:hypothetical protein
MMRASLVFLVLVFLAFACSREPAPQRQAPVIASSTATEITITEPGQREAAVGRSVVVIGLQTRTKQPTVNGIDVDGDYELSDKKVVARGILEKTVVPERPRTKDDLEVASRGAGTYYSVIDPTTKMLAKTKLVE